MHSAARQFCVDHALLTKHYGDGLDIGGRDVNGHCRDLWPYVNWTIIDNYPASPDTQMFIYADATKWEPDKEYNLVLCTEVFEHTPDWPLIIRTAYNALIPGGSFLITTAGPGRIKHSAIDGAELHTGEYYNNVLPHQLGMCLRRCGFKALVTFNPDACDTYAYALKL